MRLAKNRNESSRLSLAGTDCQPAGPNAEVLCQMRPLSSLRKESLVGRFAPFAPPRTVSVCHGCALSSSLKAFVSTVKMSKRGKIVYRARKSGMRPALQAVFLPTVQRRRCACAASRSHNDDPPAESNSRAIPCRPFPSISRSWKRVIPMCFEISKTPTQTQVGEI